MQPSYWFSCPLPIGYAIYRFPSVKKFHAFAQHTGHGSHCAYRERGVLAGIYEGDAGYSEAAAWARAYGATRCREQPATAPKCSRYVSPRVD